MGILVFVTSILFLGYIRFVGLFGELFFPSIVDFVGIEVGEDEVEHVRIPIGGMTLDAFFDILVGPKETRISGPAPSHVELWGKGRISPLEAQASRKYYRREK